MDARTSQYARLLQIPTRYRKTAPIGTYQLACQLEEAVHHSVHQLYSVIYHSQELNSLTASKRHPTETLRYHLIGVANWVLSLLQTRSVHPSAVSTVLAGQPGAIPGPVEI